MQSAEHGQNLDAVEGLFCDSSRMTIFGGVSGGYNWWSEHKKRPAPSKDSKVRAMNCLVNQPSGKAKSSCENRVPEGSGRGPTWHELADDD